MEVSRFVLCSRVRLQYVPVTALVHFLSGFTYLSDFPFALPHLKIWAKFNQLFVQI